MSLRHALALLSLLFAVVPPVAADDWLSSQQWQRRLVLVTGFDSSEAAAVLGREVERLQASLQERRLSVWRVDPGQIVWVGGAAPLQASALQLSSTELRSQLKLRDRGLHLIGLDGGLKATRAEVARFESLIAAVDSMPMRVREMRQHP